MRGRSVLGGGVIEPAAHARRVVYTFRPRFVEPIERGLKRQTIRRERRLATREGDILLLRAWTGRPRWSPQLDLCEPRPCLSVTPICIKVWSDTRYLKIALDGRDLDVDQVDEFARADGFQGVGDMADFWLQTHGSDLFRGVVLTW